MENNIRNSAITRKTPTPQATDRISTAPIRKHSRILGETGAMEKHSISTIQIIGRTAWSASCHFSFSFVRIFKFCPYPFPCDIGIITRGREISNKDGVYFLLCFFLWVRLGGRSKRSSSQVVFFPVSGLRCPKIFEFC